MELIGFILTACGAAVVVALAIDSALTSYRGSRVRDMLNSLLWGIAMLALLAGVVLVFWSNPPHVMEVQQLKKE